MPINGVYLINKLTPYCVVLFSFPKPSLYSRTQLPKDLGLDARRHLRTTL